MAGVLQLAVDDDVMRSMVTARIFKDSGQRVNSIDIHRTADLLITAGEDDSIQLIDTATGTRRQVLWCKKYGVQNICWTHSESAVIFATNKGADHQLRYMDVHNNKFLRFFRGHTHRVTTLSVSPKNDLFMSTSQDKTVRIWDLRTTQCQGMMQVPGQPCATFDQQGLVFTVATDSGVIKLYDIRNFDRGPFDTFTIPDLANLPVSFSCLRLSNDGKLLLAVCEGRIFVIDAFKGDVLRKFTNGTPDGGASPEACFSSDGQYVLSGTEDRCIRAWNIATGADVAAWYGSAGIPGCVKCAPNKVLVASACSGGSTILWLPDLKALQKLQQNG